MTKDDDIIDMLKDFKTYDVIAKSLGVSKSRIANTKRLYYIKKTLDDTPLVRPIKSLGLKVSEYISKEKAVLQAKQKNNSSFATEDFDFLKKLIAKCTHRRAITQLESLRALDIFQLLKELGVLK